MIKSYDKANAAETLRFHEVRSPIAGRVIGRELTLGEYVDRTHAAFTIADLSVVWVETAIAPADISFVKEGQTAYITNTNSKAEGKLVFVSPVIDQETRSAKAIIELDNKDGIWRPGEFVTALIATSAQAAGMTVPKDAIQSIGGKPALFVRTVDGFEKRDVVTGREDTQRIEIISGLKPGEQIAVSNTFTLKAELGKSEAEHDH
jgi:cobalt-zinc-cadmium efflux system membrane fusion protein